MRVLKNDRIMIIIDPSGVSNSLDSVECFSRPINLTLVFTEDVTGRQHKIKLSHEETDLFIDTINKSRSNTAGYCKAYKK